MRILTEQELRDLYRIEPYETFALPAETRLTPAARQFLVDRRIPIMEDQTLPQTPPGCRLSKPASQPIKSPLLKLKTECTTHLNGQEVVLKSHPRIRFRGEMDGLYAELLELELYVETHAHEDLKASVRGIRKYVGQMMTSDATGKPLNCISFKGWTPEEIRQRSHNPKQYYGVGHFRAHPKNGELMLKLNTLRTHIRYSEIAAVEAFTVDGRQEPERPDLILALNRLSSLVYILMCELRSQQTPGGDL